MCRLASPSFDQAVAYGLYDGRMKGAIHALKYSGIHPAARRLGGMLAEAIARLAAEAPAEMLVVPVPLHRTKQSQRGFNQARVLAGHALEALRRSHPAWRLTLASSTLMRLRVTASQAGLNPKERRENVRGAFHVAEPAVVAGKHVLLIDDILTTGATARAASLALMRAGAASVSVATLARARRATGPGRTSFAADEDNFGPDEFGTEELDADGGASDSIMQGSERTEGRSGSSSHDQPSF